MNAPHLPQPSAADRPTLICCNADVAAACSLLPAHRPDAGAVAGVAAAEAV